MRKRSSALALATTLMLLLLLAVALQVRARDLPLQARLDVDEARLILAAQGVAEHGWPVFPSGKLYTRGLVQSYLMGPSLRLFGDNDVAARLPSILAGVLLVLVTYWYGQRLAGPLAGLGAAVLTATSEPLIAASREAWLYSLFVLLWVLALMLVDRAVLVGDRPALLLGSGAVALSFFAHELGVLLLPAFGLALLWRGRAGVQEHLWKLTPALLPIAGGLALWAVFALSLRADTAAGALGEVDTFGSLRRGDLAGLRFYLEQLFPAVQSWLLLLAALAGLALGSSAQRQRLVPLLVAALPLLLVASFALPLRPRYGLVLLPLLYLLAAFGLVSLGGWLYRRRPSLTSALAGASLGLLVIAAQIDFDDLRWNDRPTSRSHAFWIADLYALGYRPGDLVMTDASTIVHRHLGRTDYWLRSRNYDRYVTLSRGRRYDLHTGALLIRTVEEYERRVEAPNRGRTLWVIASNTSYSWGTVLEPKLQTYFGKQATAQTNSRDGTTIYKLEP